MRKGEDDAVFAQEERRRFYRKNGDSSDSIPSVDRPRLRQVIDLVYGDRSITKTATNQGVI